MGIVWTLEGDDRWMQLEMKPRWRSNTDSFTAQGLREENTGKYFGIEKLAS